MAERAGSPLRHDVVMPTPERPAPRRRALEYLHKTLEMLGVHGLRRRRAPGATVLMYHSVPGPDVRQWIDPRNTVPPLVFEEQMKFLAAHRRVRALAELVEAVKAGRSLEPGSVVITFDDGYLDNYTVAAPVLARLGLPATFFLATGYVDRREPQWIDQLHSWYLARRSQSLDLGRIGAGRFQLDDQAQVNASYHLLARALLTASAEDRQRLFSDLEGQLEPSAPPPRLTMGWSEVEELTAMSSGFEIGVHTRDHRSLPGMEATQIEQELTGCIADLESALGRAPRFFSFPYGRTDKTSKTAAMARFHAAVVTEPPGLVTAHTDPFAIPRVSAPSDPALFRLYTNGAYPGLSQRLTGRA